MTATLSGRFPSKFSPEIYDMFIDNLHGSKKDLSTCSLICKSWLPGSRYHLFGEVIYRPDFAHFLATSTHSVLAISSYIRKVAVKGPLGGYSEKDFAESILRLPRLTNLHFEQLSWLSLGLPTILSHHPSVFHQILRLSIQSVVCPSFATLVHFLNSFSALEELSLENVAWDDIGSISADTASGDGATPKASNLRKLRVVFCHNRVMLNWLHYGVISDAMQEPSTPLSGQYFPHLCSVSLPDILPAEADIFGIFLASLGESLEYLEIGFLVDNVDGRTKENWSRSLTLTHNTRLKSIILHEINLFQFPSFMMQTPTAFPDTSSIITPRSPYAWIASFISTLLSVDVQTIGLHVWLSAEAQLDSISWVDLSKALLRSRASHIRFQISGMGRDVELVEGWFRKRMRSVENAETGLEFRFCGSSEFFVV